MRRTIFMLIIAAQVLYLGVTTFVQECHLATGRTVLLETVPVDPRDLLRGDYVILRYKISTLDRSLFQPPLSEGELYSGQDVYVQLERREPYDTGGAVSRARKEAQSRRQKLRGAQHSKSALREGELTPPASLPRRARHQDKLP